MKSRSRKQKRILWGILTPVLALILAFLLLCVITMCTVSPTFLGRVLVHWDSSVYDYQLFPARSIRKSENPFRYPRKIDPAPTGCLLREKRLPRLWIRRTPPPF